MMDQIERRKENIPRIWDYKRVEHIPIMLRMVWNPWAYTTREHFLHGDLFPYAYDPGSNNLTLLRTYRYDAVGGAAP